VPGNLLVRADATPAMGTGHIMRTLALAHAWHAAGGQVTYLSHCPAPGIPERIRAAGAGLIEIEGPHPELDDLDTTLALLDRLKTDGERHPPPWVVTDGYHFDAEYQRAIRAAGARLLVVDDMGHLDRYEADVLLNPNLAADRLAYRVAAHTRLLLGPRYALIRPEFLACRPARRDVPETARKILVLAGGSDPTNLTGKIVEALSEWGEPGLDVRVVVGAANPRADALRGQIARCRVNVELHVAPRELPELMARAEMAVSAGGSTCWELALMQVPALLAAVAENQRWIAEPLAAAGAATYLGRCQDLTPAKIAVALSALSRDRASRERQCAAGCRLVDGAGAVRVMDALAGR